MLRGAARDADFAADAAGRPGLVGELEDLLDLVEGQAQGAAVGDAAGKGADLGVFVEVDIVRGGEVFFVVEVRVDLIDRLGCVGHVGRDGVGGEYDRLGRSQRDRVLWARRCLLGDLARAPKVHAGEGSGCRTSCSAGSAVRVSCSGSAAEAVDHCAPLPDR